MTKSDIQLKQDIEMELRWDPQLNAAQIGVAVDDGAVSLLGAVDTYAQRCAAEEATKRVAGVRSFAQDLTVKLATDHARSDAEIAAAVEHAFKWHVYVPSTVTAKVQNGNVLLEGHVDSHYQSDAAMLAVRSLKGVSSVYNAIEIRPLVSAEQVKDKVEAALERQAKADASSIKINTMDRVVTLTGTASSWRAIEDAANAAWAAPGVAQVVDRIVLST